MPTAEKFGKREVGEDWVRISGNPAPAWVFVEKEKEQVYTWQLNVLLIIHDCRIFQEPDMCSLLDWNIWDAKNCSNWTLNWSWTRLLLLVLIYIGCDSVFHTFPIFVSSLILSDNRQIPGCSNISIVLVGSWSCKCHDHPEAKYRHTQPGLSLYILLPLAISW